MANPDSPLNDQHLAQIQNALDVIARTENQIELAKRAGIDVMQLEQQLASSKTRLLSLKNTYFPGA